MRSKASIVGVAALILAMMASIIAPAAAVAAERAFLQVETADIDASEAWYSRAFGLKKVNHFKRPKFDQRILAGPDLIVELVESKPAKTKSEAAALGIYKAGVEVADFDRKLAAWRVAGIAPAKGLFLDEALGLATAQLEDPDGNIVQVFGSSAGPFDATVKVSPDMALDGAAKTTR